MMKVLIVESEFLHQDTWVGNAVERLADALSQQNVTVIKSTSFDDGFAILSSNEAIDCLMFSYQMEHPDEHQNVRQLIGKLHERQQNVPVFLLGDREKALAAMDRDLLELVDEFAWILEDTADFIAGRAVAAMTRYRQQLLPPLFSALMKYSDIHEYSWAAPGHQGGVGFTKTPAGRIYHDYYGENLFRTDMGIERTSLGSLLDHTGAFGESEKYAARVFGADRSWSVVVGTSGSNRTIMQACMTDNDVVVVDRNCHKSIEQGLMLTGAKPVYMVPSRNRYGIIGPIYPQEMQPETLQKKISESPLTKDKAGQKPSYCVVTNCTYDGVCYNAKEAQDLLEKTSDRLHFDEAWYGYARFNPIYADHYAMRGEPGDHNGPTVFATHSTHKLLNALSQASYIHVREGRGAINFSRFNQAYMMHATTSPLYAICASNDVAVSMMDGNSGLSLTQEVIDEAVDFRQAMARLYKEFTADGSWFFKPWNKEVVTDPQTGKTYDFADAPTKLLTTVQDCWVMHPGESWHGFKDIPDNWSMLDPIKVSILAPGMGEDGELEETGVLAAQTEGYACDGVTTARMAEQSLEAGHYSLVVLDLGLPDEDGLHFLARIRQKKYTLPVLILTARDTLTDKIAGLDVGADDYLVKPFALEELHARIRALLRRHNNQGESELIVGNLTLNMGRRQVWMGGEELILTPKEYALLSRLMLKAGSPVHREILYNDIYNWDNEPSTNTLEVHIHNLRDKVGKARIRTVRGFGYMLVANEEN